MLVNPGNVGFALDGQIVLRWRFFFLRFFWPVGAALASAEIFRRARQVATRTQLGMIIGGNRIRSEMRICQRVPRGATRPSCTWLACPLLNERAQGRPGARCTRGLVCNGTKKCAHEHTGPAESIRPSLRNGLTAYGALSPETNSFCLRRRRIDGLTNPVGLRTTSASLTPATGARTTRFCRTQQRRSSCADRSLTAPRRSLRPPCNASRARCLRP